MWDEKTIRELLEQVACGNCAADEAMSRLRALPVENLEFARIDHHRALRQGFTEVVYCAGKTPDQAARFARIADAVVVGSALVDEVRAAVDEGKPASSVKRISVVAQSLSNAISSARGERSVH